MPAIPNCRLFHGSCPGGQATPAATREPLEGVVAQEAAEVA